MKKIVTLCLVITIIVGASGSITSANTTIPDNLDTDNAIETSEYTHLFTTTRSQNEIDQDFADIKVKHIAELENELNGRGVEYEYYYEYFSSVLKTLSGEAGNQLSGGYQFPTGGGFFHTNSGGPKPTGSISVPLPFPWNFISISFSINLGVNGASGQFYNVPDNTNYFKLWIDKTVQVQPYVVWYRLLDTNDAWQVWSSGSTTVEISCSGYAKKV
ncbi:MAG: hypothetical protein FWG88_01835 [Oscillospiraceae bacterium]|nr:hypothetical protein [Oscillospiraceae bacterium]